MQNRTKNYNKKPEPYKEISTMKNNLSKDLSDNSKEHYKM